jgi:threonyl-tRNA synthetase
MPLNIFTPEGQARPFDVAPSGLEFAKSISTSLAKQVVVMRVNGELKDLSATLADGDLVELLTLESVEGLELVRHDAAHVLAQAVKSLYPETQVTIGPVIKNGFYYDFYRETSFTPEDLVVIEKRMRQIVKQNIPLEREEWDRDQAIAFFREQGETFKAELIEDLPEDAVISLYRQGDFIDLCRGPHLPSTGKVGNAFRLTHVAGAYWRGDSSKAQLQRIYGTAWRTREELDNYTRMLEEAEKRDHRKLGKQMGLFSFNDHSVGNVFWHPKGWRMYRTLERFIACKMEEAGYEEISTPQLLDRVLWEKSGHWGKYDENMFTTEDENRIHALKPMNCPGAVQVYKTRIRSYRDLPIRYSELNTLHRNEPSGGLHGLLRLRSFRQDDAHIFCTEEQITDETRDFTDFLMKMYKSFGFESIRIKLADRPDKRIGSDEVWDKAEQALRDAMAALGLDYTVNPGEGAFYGPKLEFVLTDAIGRDWQCGTMQVDFSMPSAERLDCVYTGDDNAEHRPVMLHRAALGSLERFLGILLESTAGHLPIWLTPVPVVIATITNSADEYAKDIHQRLRNAGVYSELDLRNEKIGYKVREHSAAKVPYIWVLGEKEAADDLVTIRTLGSRETRTLSVDDAVGSLIEERVYPF